MADLPAVWAQKYQQYLGITPSNHKEGILQVSELVRVSAFVSIIVCVRCVCTVMSAFLYVMSVRGSMRESMHVRMCVCCVVKSPRWVFFTHAHIFGVLN